MHISYTVECKLSTVFGQRPSRMANKAINIKLREDTVSQAFDGWVGGVATKGCHLAIGILNSFALALILFNCHAHSHSYSSSRDKCIDAFAFSIIILLGFFFALSILFFFCLFFPLQVDAKSFQLLWRHFLIALICFSRTFSPASIHDKSFSAHTPRQRDRQTKVEPTFALIFFFFFCLNLSVFFWFLKFCNPLAGDNPTPCTFPSVQLSLT